MTERVVDRRQFLTFGLQAAALLLATACVPRAVSSTESVPAQPKPSPAPESLPTLTPASTPTPETNIPPVAAPTETPAPVADYATGILITATEFKYYPSSFSIRAGDRVILALRNTDKIAHDLVISDLFSSGKKHGIDLHISATPGEVTTQEFRVTKSGVYKFHCSIPGHEEAGMTGTMFVKKQINR